MCPEQHYDVVGGNVNTENSQFGVMPHSPISPEYHDQISPGIARQHPKADMEDVYSMNSAYKDADFKVLKQLYMQQQREEAIEINEGIIQQVVQFGYPESYLIRCLNQHELNYATTCYLLLSCGI